MKKSNEEKYAEKIANLISDLRIDLDEIGIALARMSPTTIYNRLILVTEAAEAEKEQDYARNTID